MDTDDLSVQTYNGIITESEKFHHDLALQFGVLASECQDDNDYLNNVEAMIKEWRAGEVAFEQLADEIFFGEYVDINSFRATLEKILSNIAQIRKTPMDERVYEEC